MTTDLSRLDVPLEQLEARVRVNAAVAKLRWLLAHPELATVPNPASACERAEWRHWMHDADPDSQVPVSRVDLTKRAKEAS